MVQDAQSSTLAHIAVVIALPALSNTLTAASSPLIFLTLDALLTAVSRVCGGFIAVAIEVADFAGQAAVPGQASEVGGDVRVGTYVTVSVEVGGFPGG